jgi:hypothetical protein
MIKILKEGFTQKKYKTIFKGTCTHCKCEFEFEVEDCDYIEKSFDGFLQITCPCCKRGLSYYRDNLETRLVEVEE